MFDQQRKKANTVTKEDDGMILSGLKEDIEREEREKHQKQFQLEKEKLKQSILTNKSATNQKPKEQIKTQKPAEPKKEVKADLKKSSAASKKEESKNNMSQPQKTG